MILVCFLTIVVLMIILQLVYRRNEAFSQLYLGSSTKCFACERSLPDGYQWLGQPTKDFSSQAYLAQADPRLGSFGGREKCFSCQAQMADVEGLQRRKRSPNYLSGWRFPGSYVD